MIASWSSVQERLLTSLSDFFIHDVLPRATTTAFLNNHGCLV